MCSSHSLHFVRSVINLVGQSCFSEIFEQAGDWQWCFARSELRNKIKNKKRKIGSAFSSDRIVRLSWFDGKSQKSGHHMLAESARIRQKYTCCATGATKVSFPHDSAVRIWVSLPPRISGFTTYDIRGCLFHRGIRTYSSWQFVRCHCRAAAAPFHAILKTNRLFVCIPQIRHICRSEYLFRRAAFGRF